MTDTAVPPRQRGFVRSTVGGALKTVGLALTAPLYVFAPRYTRHFVRTMSTVAVRTFELPKQVAPSRRRTGQDADRIRQLTARLDAYLDADDWAGISGTLADLDCTRERLQHSDERLIDVAMDHLRFAFSVETGMPNMCNFDYYYMIPDSVLVRIEEAARGRPGDLWLTALLAQVHIDRGWCARGGGWSDDVTEEGWIALMNSFQTAHALLQRFDVEEVRSPLLARVQFQLLATADAGNGLDQARAFYHDWSDLDVGNPLPHRSFAFFALPRWFGSWSVFEEEARAAAKRTRHSLGKAAYALFYLEAFEYDEDDALENLDVSTFIEALDELIRRDIDPVAQALRAIVLIGDIVEPEPITLIGEFLEREANQKRDALRPMVRYLFDTYVTHLPTEEGSDFEEKVLDQMVLAYCEELKAGQKLTITPDGVQVAPPQHQQ